MSPVIIPNRYLNPKWQAYVDFESSFVFSNGLRISSLWELKVALVNLPEDILNSHQREDGNDIVNWIKGAIGDTELAQELAKYSHRWGWVVALERHMMRTVALPSYVAKRWMRQVANPFVFSSGESVSSISELGHILEHISDEVVDFHRERVPNDISVWIADIVGDYELADLVEEAGSRAQMVRFVADHLEMLHEASEC